MGGRTRNSTPAKAAAPAKRLATATAERVASLNNLLIELYPDSTVELDHTNPYQLLAATILAAQSTDKIINTITPALFARYPDPTALAQADPVELEPMIYKSGFFRMKGKHLIEAARAIVERHGGEVPRTMAELVALPGVARKTANVVLGCAMGIHEGIVVDTHVSRLAPLLGLTVETEPVKIEQDLMQITARDQWTKFAHGLIWHGRRVCIAKRPDCEHCTLAPLCPSAGVAIVDAKQRAIEATKRGVATRAETAKHQKTTKKKKRVSSTSLSTSTKKPKK